MDNYLPLPQEHLQGSSSHNLLGIMDEQKHKQLRRVVNPLLSLKSVRESEELMQEPMRHFVKSVQQLEGRSVDIVQLMNVVAVGESRGLSPESHFHGFNGHGDRSSHCHHLW